MQKYWWFNSSGLCAGLMITGLHFQLLLTLPPSDTEFPVIGMKTIFKNLCYNADHVCFAKTVSPAPVFVQIPGSHHLGTRLRLVSGFRDPGSVLILGQVTQYGNPYLICIICIASASLSISESHDYCICANQITTNNKQLEYGHG